MYFLYSIRLWIVSVLITIGAIIAILMVAPDNQIDLRVEGISHNLGEELNLNSRDIIVYTSFDCDECNSLNDYLMTRYKDLVNLRLKIEQRFVHIDKKTMESSALFYHLKSMGSDRDATPLLFREYLKPEEDRDIQSVYTKLNLSPIDQSLILNDDSVIKSMRLVNNEFRKLNIEKLPILVSKSKAYYLSDDGFQNYSEIINDILIEARNDLNEQQ